MWKEKILIQGCVCLIIISAYFGTGFLKSEKLQDFRIEIIGAMSRHYTINDVLQKGKDTADTVSGMPAVISAKLNGIYNLNNYGEPVDHCGYGQTTAVYAVAGGQVTETGQNKKYNKYVMIRHDDAVSIYGNCSKIYVNKGEHVRQGHVIASYYNDGENEFYYELNNE